MKKFLPWIPVIVLAILMLIPSVYLHLTEDRRAEQRKQKEVEMREEGKEAARQGKSWKETNHRMYPGDYEHWLEGWMEIHDKK